MVLQRTGRDGCALAIFKFLKLIVNAVTMIVCCEGVAFLGWERGWEGRGS